MQKVIKNFSTKYISDETVMVKTVGQYADGSTAIQIFDLDGCIEATATVALPDRTPDKGNVFIKNWSENEGMYNALVEAGVIGEKVRDVRAGFATAYECPLNVE